MGHPFLALLRIFTTPSLIFITICFFKNFLYIPLYVSYTKILRLLVFVVPICFIKIFAVSILLVSCNYTFLLPLVRIGNRLYSFFFNHRLLCELQLKVRLYKRNYIRYSLSFVMWNYVKSCLLYERNKTKKTFVLLFRFNIKRFYFYKKKSRDFSTLIRAFQRKWLSEPMSLYK